MRAACYRESQMSKRAPSEKRWAGRPLRQPVHLLAAFAALATYTGLAQAQPAAVTAAPAGDLEPPVRLPPGSRRVDPSRFALSRGIGEATSALETRLRASGATFERIGPVRVRGVELTRFLCTDPSSSWLALHISRKEGRTFLDVVPRQAPLTNPRSSR